MALNFTARLDNQPFLLHMTKNNNIKVLVAMSGGVDSSVAAGLLKKQGYQVSGVFMHFWVEKNLSGCTVLENKCCGEEAEQDVRAVAMKLNIPFYIFHFEKEFKKSIVDYFLKENSRGDTPNPCVRCNQYIKFGLLLKKAQALGFDYVATGHYLKKVNGKLFTARDTNKDQSYFLYTATPQSLKHFLFPLGRYKKEKVRQIAKKMGLSTFAKPESFDLCFVGDSHTEFLQRHLNPKKGDIVDEQGKILGVHNGLALYTVGQRKDIKLSGGPYYVLGFNFKKNHLVVTNNVKDKNLFKSEMLVKNVNWISVCPQLPLRVKIKIRYRHKSVSATISRKISSGKYLINFNRGQRAITPGQSAVFYNKKEVLGGGIIN